MERDREFRSSQGLYGEPFAQEVHLNLIVKARITENAIFDLERNGPTHHFGVKKTEFIAP